MIDLSPLTSVGIEILAAVLLALGSYGVYRLNKWLGLKADSEVRTYLDMALYRAVEYGKGQANAKAGKMTVKTSNEVVTAAVTYAVAAVPDALERFGITPEKLADMIRARLPEHADAS